MLNDTDKIRKELDKISWLSPTQIVKETIRVILVSIFFALSLGGVNLLLQKIFNHLLAK